MIKRLLGITLIFLVVLLFIGIGVVGHLWDEMRTFGDYPPKPRQKKGGVQ